MLYRVKLKDSDRNETHSVCVEAESPKRASDRVLDFASRGVYLSLGIVHGTRVEVLDVTD